MDFPGPKHLAAGVFAVLVLGAPAFAQQLTGRPGRPGSRLPVARIMPLGDSITHGGGGFASYRYPLWYQLQDGRIPADFVGTRITVNGGDCCGNPNTSWYPEYYTSFDREHEGYAGWRTDDILRIAFELASINKPDLVLIHLGTNDIGQFGSNGVINAQANLRRIIDHLRAARPVCRIALAQVIPIGPGSNYFVNANQVAPLNAAIANVAIEKTELYSPIILVDQNTGYDLGLDMQVDGLHPNVTGEIRMATIWESAIQPILLPSRPPPHPGVTHNDPSFEVLGLADHEVVEDPQGLDWVFAGTPLTQRGIFNPGGDTYLGAEASGTPVGADGEDVAYILNDGGASEEAAVFQTLATTLEPGTDYILKVAIGNRLPTNPYGPSTWGGFRVELLAGNRVIAAEADSFVPLAGTFDDVVLQVSSNSVPPHLLGQALTVRLSTTGTDQLDATDFDNVRLFAQ